MTPSYPSGTPFAEPVGLAFQDIEGVGTGCLGPPFLTNLPELDQATGGILRRELTVLVGGTGSGSTSLGVRFVLRALLWAEPATPCLVFALDKTPRDIARLMIHQEAYAPHFQRGQPDQFEERDWPNLTMSAGLLSSAPLWVDSTPGIRPIEVVTRIRRAQKRNGVGLVVIDDWRSIKGQDNPLSNLAERLAELAEELNLAILVIVNAPEGELASEGALRAYPSLRQNARLKLIANRDQESLSCTRIQVHARDMGGVRQVILRNEPILLP